MTNDLTTGEIVRALREPEAFCEGCNHHGEPRGCNLNGIGCRAWDLAQEAADRLEQQEQRITELERELAAANQLIDTIYRSGGEFVDTHIEAYYTAYSGAREGEGK